MISDSELLRRFAQTNSEDAFAEIVRRHVNLVYSAALRHANGDEHLAKDVAQNVFADLARKANSLSRRENLSGWLYTSAHFAAAKIIRGENRRRDREEKFMRESENSGMGVPPVQSANETDWNKIRPLLDDAMHELKESDRDAILFRYFENRQFAEVGAKLGLSENTARMRVERALEKLRKIFLRRGVAATATLASAISANAIQTAPATLAATLTATSIASAGTGTFTFLKIMTATKIKLAVSAIVVAGAATAFMHQQQTQNKLRAQNESLQQQIAQLQTDSENFSNRLAEIGDAKKLPDDSNNELLKLRGEVGVLQQETEEANQKTQIAEQKLATTLSAQAKFTKQQTATVNAVKYLSLDMRIYAGDHNNQFPTNDSLYALVKSIDGNTKIFEGIPAIEYINRGIKLNAQNEVDYPNMVVIRERIANQAPDGTWHRIYGFADGSIQTAISYDGNFDAWEKANTYSPPQNPNQ